MFDNYYAVIMAGGGGTRLWPLSRSARPKQMLQLIDDRSMFQTSVERLEGLFAPDHIYVVTVKGASLRTLRPVSADTCGKLFAGADAPWNGFGGGAGCSCFAAA